MKPEYKNKSEELLNGVDKKIDVIVDMVNGKRPADQKLLLSYCRDIKQSIDSTLNLISLS